jgi:predicted ATPase
MTNKKKPLLAVSQFRLKNFKAIRDTGAIRFTPLTVFIGNNGVGKSSIVEGLETLQAIATQGLDAAMQRWHGFEYIHNQAAQLKMRSAPDGTEYSLNPITMDITGNSFHNLVGYETTGIRVIPLNRTTFRASTQIAAGPALDSYFYLREAMTSASLDNRKHMMTRDLNSSAVLKVDDENPASVIMSPDESVMSYMPVFEMWQFVRLNPESMMEPKPVRRVTRYLPLAVDGSNIAEYLLELRRNDGQAVDGIIETLKFILPYAQDLQPIVASEVGRSVYLQLAEQNFKLPSWLFSTGTLRLLALLAVLRNPDPPPLVVIEEIENGLDPRTIALIVEEIRSAIGTGRTQVIVTTHSPYLLDLLSLSQIIIVERIDGAVTFTRPADQPGLTEWSQKFSPGRLYTMNRLGRG